MRRTATLLLSLAALGLTGCGGRDAGPTGQPAATPTTATATTTVTPATTTTTAPPGGTAASATSTGSTLAPSPAITFRKLTIRLRPGWTARPRGDSVEVASGATCRRSQFQVDCPGFRLLGPADIAEATELGPYDPGQPWHPGTGVEGCPIDRDNLGETTPAAPRKQGLAPVGGKQAIYREWVIACRHVTTNKVERSYVQRVWYLPTSRILVVDEWSVPGLAGVLAAGTWTA